MNTICRTLLLSLLTLVLFAGQAQAAIAVRGTSSAGVASGTLTLSMPTGTVANDVMVASIAVRPKTITITPPSGWMSLQSHQSTNSGAASTRMITYWRRATSGESGPYAFTFSGGTHTGTAGGIVSFSGVDTTTAIDVSGGNTTGSGFTHTATGITTTVANAMVVSIHAFSSVTSNWTPPGSMTEAVDAASEARPSTAGVSLEMNYVSQAAAGATGDKAAVAASGGTDAGYGVAHILALKPITTTMTIATPSAVNEGNSGTTTLAFTVSLSATATASTTATYAFADVTATGGSSCTTGIDYINTGGTVTIASGSSTGTINVTLCGDTTYEANETFTVTLSSPVNAVLGSPSSATGTLTNDDTAPTISIAAASTTEGNSGTKNLSLTVTQSAASGLATTATYTLTNGTATGGGSCSGSTDFVSTGGTVTISAGSTTGTIDVPLCGDTTFESDETLTVTLSSPTNATLGSPSSATGTLTNDDVDSSACYTDTFTGSDGAAPSSDWKTTSSSGSFGQPRIMSNRLRLTDTSGNVSTAAHLQKLFPGAGNKIVIEFDLFAYGGTGADGVAFTMSDAAVTASAGAFGGSLGYAQKTGIDGFVGGWLGIGFDEFGNFANPTEGRSGGPALTVDAVTIRGSGSGTTGYGYHATSGTLSPGIDASTVSGTITVVGSGAQAKATSGNITPALPTHATDDLLVCSVLSRDNVAHSVSGWTQYYTLTNGTDLRGSLFYKIATSASETAPTITHSSGNGIQARCTGFRGVDTSNPFVVAYGTSNTSGDDKINTPSINAAGASNVIALIAGYIDNNVGTGTNSDFGLSTNPQDITFTQAYFSAYDPSGGSNDSTLSLHYATQTTGGTLGAYAFDTDSNEDSIGVVMALRPATSSSSSGHRYRITVDHTDGAHAYTTVERDTTATGSSYSTVIATYDAKAQSGQAAVPTSWLLSFTGSTGGSNNYHEIDNLSVCAAQPILAVGPDHYVISHSGTAITCEAEPVTFTGHDNAHARADAGTKTLSISTSTSSGSWVASADSCTQTCYNSSGTSQACTGTFTATTGNNGQASYLFATGETGVRLCLRHNATGTVGINVTDGTATESTGTASAEASPGADPGLVFSNTGFRFYADGNVDTLGNLTAGLRSDVTDATWQPSPQTIVIRALKSGETTPPKCVSLLGATAKTVQFAYQCTDPAACHASSGGLEVNGTAVTGSAAVPTPASNVSVTFDGSGSGTLNLKYWDVGSIKLYAAASIADAVTGGTASIVSGASNAFLVKPYGFTVMACSGSAPCTSANSAATDGTGSILAKAGDTFNATLRAVAYGGTVITPSFGLGTGNGTETVPLTHTLVAPSGGNSGSLGGTTSVLRSSFTDGVASVTNLTWSEVGVMTLTAANSTFQTVAASATGTSGNVGRFTPHHLGVSGTLTNRSDLATPGGSFSYMGEPMRLELVVTAYNKGEAATQNYTGNFAKLSAATLGTSDLSNWICTSGTNCMGLSATSGSNLSSRLALDTTSTNSITPTNTTTSGGSTVGWATGISYFKLNAAFNRDTNPDGPYATLKFGTKPLDSDGVTIPPRLATDTTHCVNLDASTGTEEAACNPGSTESNLRRKIFETAVRYGRLRLTNAYGSERLTLTIPAEMQYYDSSSGYWLTNTLDSANLTGLWSVSPSGSTALSGTGASGSTTLTLGNSLTSGIASLTASAPGSGGLGYVDATVTVPSYLQWTWLASAGMSSPKARASFGLYRGNNRIIYRRERY